MGKATLNSYHGSVLKSQFTSNEHLRHVNKVPRWEASMAQHSQTPLDTKPNSKWLSPSNTWLSTTNISPTNMTFPKLLPCQKSWSVNCMKLKSSLTLSVENSKWSFRMSLIKQHALGTRSQWTDQSLTVTHPKSPNLNLKTSCKRSRCFKSCRRVRPLIISLKS